MCSTPTTSQPYRGTNIMDEIDVTVGINLRRDEQRTRSLPSKDPICYVPLSEPNAYIQITAIGYSRSTSCVAKISIPVFNYFHNAKIHTTKPLLSEPNKSVKQFALGVFVVYPYEVIQSSKSESDKQRTTETNRSMKMLMYGSSKTTSNKRIVL